MDGEWAEGYEEVSKEAILFYQKQFSFEDTTADLSLLHHVQVMIDQESNDTLCQIPTTEEVKAILSLMVKVVVVLMD